MPLKNFCEFLENEVKSPPICFQIAACGKVRQSRDGFVRGRNEVTAGRDWGWLEGRTDIMKTLLRLLPVVLLCSCASQSDQKVPQTGIDPRINAPLTLEFLGEPYNAGYSACDKDKCIVEYFRAGEGRKTWKTLL